MKCVVKNVVLAGVIFMATGFQVEAMLAFRKKPVSTSAHAELIESLKATPSVRTITSLVSASEALADKAVIAEVRFAVARIMDQFLQAALKFDVSSDVESFQDSVMAVVTPLYGLFETKPALAPFKAELTDWFNQIQSVCDALDVAAKTAAIVVIKDRCHSAKASLDQAKQESSAVLALVETLPGQLDAIEQEGRAKAATYELALARVSGVHRVAQARVEAATVAAATDFDV